jgi:hypothetical protein
VHTIAHLVTYSLVSGLASGADATREPAVAVAATLPLSYRQLFLSDKVRSACGSCRAH